MNTIPPERIRVINPDLAHPDGKFILYWMIAHRRTTWNLALQRAVEWTRELRRPLLIFEALACDYRWASDRIHRFVLQGMQENARRLENSPATYYPYVERGRGVAKGLLAALAREACVVVTDDYPAFGLDRMAERAGRRLPCRVEMVDSNGLLPVREAGRDFPTAFVFRRFMQKTLEAHLDRGPDPAPLRRLPRLRLDRLPRGLGRWPAADPRVLLSSGGLARIPIDHSVVPARLAGGLASAGRVLKRFITRRLERYDADRNQPDEAVTSELSPFLHFGHVSAHQVFSEIVRHEGWSPFDLGSEASGKRAGWWGLGPSAEAFLDQLVTWRELGFNKCAMRPDYDRYESLPAWARQTLAQHVRDRRTHLYSINEFESAATHDPLWNAAQTELVREGRIHNYLRMLWGKKIVEWSESPRVALNIMIELNNKYALDGRDPNSYSGIFWVLGRFDRPWGPERPVFGKVRYMSSKNTARKVRVRNYLARYQPDA